MPPRQHAIVVLFAITACVLAFEVALTRICSVLLQYHVSFAVVSLAILGLGLGGFSGYLGTRGHAQRAPTCIDVSLLGMAPAMLLALAVLLRLPFAAHWTALLFLVLPVFACAGAVQALLLRALAQHATALYAADLIGGATGALLAVVLIDTLGGPVNTILLLSLAAAGTAMWWTSRRVSDEARRSSQRAWAVAVAALAFAAVIAQGALGIFAVRYELAPGKLIHTMMQRSLAGQPRLLPDLVHWDATSRVDVLEVRSPHGSQRMVFIDGETPTAMLSPQAPSPGATPMDVRASLAALPYRLLQPRAVLSIGSGGGYDVVIARRLGATRVDAVELNAGVLQIVERARDFTGDVYRQPGVHLHHAEGRQFVRAASSRWDLITLVLAQSLAGNMREYALSENYLYTREAFGDYLDALQPGGALALLVNDERLQQRLAATAAAELRTRDVPAERCIVALTSPNETPYDRLLIVRGQPFDAAHLQRLAEESEARSYTAVPLPGARDAPASVPDQEAWRVPATDDRPFVFHMRADLPSALRMFLLTATALMLLAWAALAWATHTSLAAERGFAVSAYFVLLGVAFMMVEVLVLQKTILIIGYPTWNLAVILAAFLLFAGLGSAVGGRLCAGRARTRLQVILVFLGLSLSSLLWILSSLHGATDAWPLATRCAVVALCIFPFAFLMGMPFPVGVRLLHSDCIELVPWYWGLNGVASVLGSALVVAVVLKTGFRVAAVLPAALYLLAAAAAGLLMPRLPAPRGHKFPPAHSDGPESDPDWTSRQPSG